MDLNKTMGINSPAVSRTGRGSWCILQRRGFRKQKFYAGSQGSLHVLNKNVKKKKNAEKRSDVESREHLSLYEVVRGAVMLHLLILKKIAGNDVMAGQKQFRLRAADNSKG